MQAVRINARGIRFISSQYSVLSVNSTRSRWMRVECRSSTDCLCVINTHSDLHARFLPNYGHNVYSSLGNHDSLDKSLTNILLSECIEASTGRYHFHLISPMLPFSNKSQQENEFIVSLILYLEPEWPLRITKTSLCVIYWVPAATISFYHTKTLSTFSHIQHQCPYSLSSACLRCT